MAERPLLEVKNLTVSFYKEDPCLPGRLEGRAIEDLSFSLAPGRTLALVGESGCGKTMTAYALMGLVPEPGKISGGEVWFQGKNLLAIPERELRALRGNKIAMIFQEPMTALNPVLTIGNQLEEAVSAHRKLSAQERKRLGIELLRQVGIPSPEERYSDYPHQLSGGMRQRIVIAMALINRPDLIIADEPTTALDVTIQRQILNLLNRLSRENSTATLLITHDLGVVRETAEEVIVMYAGRIMERANVETLFDNPAHPYTRGLMASIPGLLSRVAEGINKKVSSAQERPKRLKTIPGTVPGLWNKPGGCPFNTRCPYTFERCFRELPPLAPHSCPNHLVRCWLSADK
ncbi:MAG: ABC transporter ATP-binding protein [Desulfovibrionaceae bacterium]|nr:ABC transporter ATP-binding protein [Desulfovibrionaceae bacterium]